MAANRDFPLRVPSLFILVILIRLSKPQEMEICRICMCYGLYSVHGAYVACIGNFFPRDMSYANEHQEGSPIFGPDLFQGNMNVTRLTLDKNAIRSINDSIFARLPLLDILHLDHNLLTEIPTSHFLKRLRMYTLADNAIKDIPFSFGLNVPNLTYLDLAFNKLHQVHGNRLPTLLTYLDLTGNLIQTVNSESFFGLHKLSFLSLAKNRIAYIPDGTFSRLNLSTLHLDSNRIAVIEELSLTSSLLTLVLSGNNIRNLSRLTTAYLDNQQHSLSQNTIPYFPLLQNAIFSNVTDDCFLRIFLTGAPLLQELTMTNGYIPEIRALKHQYLNFLDLSSNFIKSIDHSTNVPRLTDINLSQNLFTSIPHFTGLWSIRILTMNFNKITVLDADNFKNLSNLRVMSLEDNAIVSLVGQFKNPNLLAVFLHNNAIKRVDSDMFSELLSLVVLYIDDNRLTKPSNLSNIPKLKTLECRDNGISIIDSKSFRNLDNLDRLALPNNFIYNISTFSDLPKLYFLILDNNPILFIGKGAFSRLSKLNTLSLRNTTIRDFPSDVLRSLAVIDLSRNALTKIPHNISHIFPSLKEIDISHNQISTFNIEAVEEFRYLESFKINGNFIPPFDISGSFIRGLHTFHFDLDSVISASVAILVDVFDLLIQGHHVIRVPDTIMCHHFSVLLVGIEMYLTNDSCTFQPASRLPSKQSKLSKEIDTHTITLRNVSLNGFERPNSIIFRTTNTLSFVESNLVDIPNWYGPQVAKTNFSQNSFQAFDIGRFLVQFPIVTHLYLDNNRIKSLVGCDQLNTVHPLQELHLSGNDLMRFPGRNCNGEFYRFVYTLNLLDLTSNSTTEIDNALIPVSSNDMPRFEIQIFVTESIERCDCSPQGLLLETEEDITMYGSCFSPLLKSNSHVIYSKDKVTCSLSLATNKTCSTGHNASILIQCPVTSRPSPLIQWIFQESPDVGFLLITGLVSVNDSRLRIVEGGLEFNANQNYINERVSVGCRAIDTWQNSVIFIIDALISATNNDWGKAENVSVVCKIDVYDAHEASIAPSTDYHTRDNAGASHKNHSPDSNSTIVTTFPGNDVISQSASSSSTHGSMWYRLCGICVIIYLTN